MSLWWAGALLSACGSISSNLGVNIQKFSLNKNAKLEKSLQKSYTKQPLWCLGLIGVICGSLGDFAALGLAAQSIVAPIASITLVSNVMFAHWGLKEPLTKRDIGGTCLIILGSTLSVAFGNHAEVTYTLDQLKELYVQSGFIAYGFIILGSCITLYCIIKKLQPIKIELVHKCAEYEVAILAVPRDPVLIETLDLHIAHLEQRYEPYEKLHPFSYCAMSGCLGAQSILFGKMLAEMIGKSFRGDNQMIYPLTYVFLGCMLFCIFSQLHFLALGLSYFDALYVVPVFQCFFISVSTLGGAAYFNEFAQFTLVQIIFFPVGISLTLTGVYILSSREMKRGITREVNGGGTMELEVGMGVKEERALSMSELSSPSDVTGIQLASRLVLPSPVNEMDEQDQPDDLPVPTTTTDALPLTPYATRSDDEEAPSTDVIVTTAGSLGKRASNKYSIPNGVPSPPSKGIPILGRVSSKPHGEFMAASMPATGSEIFGLGVNTESPRSRNGSAYAPAPIPPSSVPSRSADGRRPSSAETGLAVSRFARRYSQILENPATFGGPLSTPHISGRHSVGVPVGVAAALSATSADARTRKRSTWTNESGQLRMDRGSVFHAGLAIWGGGAAELEE